MLEAAVGASFVAVLGLAAYSDIKTRTVWAHLWWPHLMAALWLASPYALGVAGVYTGASLLAYSLGELGLADVKAVAVLALLFPEAATPTMVGAIALSIAWAYAGEGEMNEVDVPFLVPLVFSLCAVLLLF